MKLIVAGSRGFHRPRYLEDLKGAIAQFRKDNNTEITEIVHGGNMQSADFLGWIYAAERGIPVKVFPANWEKFGRKAGPLRNIEMSQYADGLVTLWDGKSPGTNHMQSIMNQANKPIYTKLIVVSHDEDTKKFVSSFPASNEPTAIKSIK